MEFAIFCVESVAEHLGKNGAEVYATLKDKSNILNEYIVQHYEVLHSQGKEYIVNDIVELMAKEGLI